jgi:hypothetical protein
LSGFDVRERSELLTLERIRSKLVNVCSWAMYSFVIDMASLKQSVP